MSDFLIVTESNGDYTKELAQLPGLVVLPMSFMVDDVSYMHYADERELPTKEFYARMRAGAKTKTAAMNQAEMTEAIEPLIREGNDILVMSFSSGLSGTAGTCAMAVEELKEKYPERKLYAMDTLCASGGEGLLVYLAYKQRQAGRSIEEVYEWTLENRLKLCHWFTVDDLMHLKRGGRVSAATAIVGSMLNIKPVLHVDDEGHLISMYTKRGRKASIRALLEEFKARNIDGADSTVFISHGDCEADAQLLARLLRDECGVTDITLSYIGPVIGSHSGPGCLALYFVGKER